MKSHSVSPTILTLGSGRAANRKRKPVSYCATMPYLLAQKRANSTWTLITGSAGEGAHDGITGIGQGALFSFANIASQENEETNVRFNEAHSILQFALGLPYIA